MGKLAVLTIKELIKNGATAHIHEASMAKMGAA